VKPLGPIPAGFEANAQGRLLIGGTVADMLAKEGTPVFVYDHARIAAQIEQFRTAFPGIALHYAAKANPYGPLLEAIAKLVDGFDVASAGELDRVSRFSLPISFAGPGKSWTDVEGAIRAGIVLNLESEGEALKALTWGKRLGIVPKLAIRVNPPFGLKGSGMKMGGLATQFGVDHDRVHALVHGVIAGGAEWHGLHIYAGSQALDAEAVIELQRATIELAALIAAQVGRAPPHVNLGGGFGIPYFAKDRPLDVERVGSALIKVLEDRPKILADTKFAIELGRWLVGEAGVYLTRVVDRKVSRGETFLVTDGGLHHMLAASGNFGQLLRRNYPLANASRFAEETCEQFTLTGCLCTPLDLLGDEVMLPSTNVGDVIAIFCAGAYGLSASPVGFLSQPEAREILI